MPYVSDAARSFDFQGKGEQLFYGFGHVVRLYPLFWALHYKFFKALYEDDVCTVPTMFLNCILVEKYLHPSFIVGDSN